MLVLHVSYAPLVDRRLAVLHGSRILSTYHNLVNITRTVREESTRANGLGP